ncbi:hypothetical protein Tco_0323586 [Tanacetum coccineum]
MDAPTIPVSFDSSEGNFGDTPMATDDFPTRTIVVTLASLGEAIRGIHEYLQGVPIEEDMSFTAALAAVMQTGNGDEATLLEQRQKAEHVAENKRKFENTSRNNQNQQQQNKRQNTGRAYTARTGEKKPYGGSKPLCAKCNYHHDEGYRVRPETYLLRVGVQGHFKRECPKLKNNKNCGNEVSNDRAPAKVYVVGHAWTNPDPNIMTGTFLLNNRYASILFNTGADRSFVSNAFSSQMDITPSTLDHYYDVELADGRIIGTWKIVRIPWGNESLIVHGDGSNQGHEARLHIISYSKTQEYMLKGCSLFLANVTTNEVEDKSEKKRLEDVPIVRDFPKVFPEDLLGLPQTRQVEFQINLIPGVARVARAPYQLAPSEMKELSEQLKELSDKGFIRPSSSP